MIVLAVVAAFDITMVVPLDETTVVPAGMPFPVMIWPADTPVRFVAVPEMMRFSVVVAPAG